MCYMMCALPAEGHVSPLTHVMVDKGDVEAE